MTTRISRALLAQILEAAAASPDREICGLMLGVKKAEAGQSRPQTTVHDYLPCANIADDPAMRFEIDPALIIRAQKQARQAGLSVLGHCHSHPRGQAAPSARDAEQAHGDGALWLICTPQGEYGMWRAAGKGLHGQFQPVSLIVEQGVAG